MPHFAAPGRACGVTAVAIASLVCPGSANASGFASARFGGEHGSVVGTNPTALYFNPAGIALEDGTDAFVDGQLALRHVTWDHPRAPSDPVDPPGGEGANTGHSSGFNVFGGPALGAATKLGRLALGLGLFVPFGGIESWNENHHFDNSAFRLAAAGVQRWHLIDATIAVIYLTAGAAYRVGPLSLGVSFNLIRSSVMTSQAKNPTGSGLPDTQREGRANLDVSGIDASFGAGAMLEAIPDRLWLAASYQAQPALGAESLKGTLALTSPSGATTFNVALNQALPDIYRLGARWRPRSDIELRVFGDYTRWSVMHTQCVAILGYACAVFPNGSDATGGVLANYRRDWNDTYGVRVSVSYWIQPDVELFSGVGFETPAVPDKTLEVSVMEADNVGLALGTRFPIGHWAHLGVSYTHLQYFDRNNTGQSTLAAAQTPTQQQDGGGRYTQWIGIVDVNVEKRF
jgi:long-chain fatty acid transport protein